jgi:hypothetical protein
MGRPRHYRITVWYLTREHLLGGIAAARVHVGQPQSALWEFVGASTKPPPAERAALWEVQYENGDGVRMVTLDMRFVREAVPVNRR